MKGNMNIESDSTAENIGSQSMPIGEQTPSYGLVMADIFNNIYASGIKRSISNQLFKEVYGEDCLPDEVASLDFASLSELRWMARELRVGPGQSFVDIACGMGGPGLWIARETGANLVGVDFSVKAIQLARERADQYGLGERARYQLADMAATNLPESQFDGAISIDALFLAPDKRAVLREVGHLLRPGAHFVFTNWEDRRLEPNTQGVSPEKIYDYRPLLNETFFEVECYEEAYDWERKMREVYMATLAHSNEIIQEMGEQAASPLIEEAKAMTELHDGKDILMKIRRILVVARRL
jgi:cyclopropane fatty-acyl-phospholipid synthase-like methyltransferase